MNEGADVAAFQHPEQVVRIVQAEDPDHVILFTNGRTPPRRSPQLNIRDAHVFDELSQSSSASWAANLC